MNKKVPQRMCIACRLMQDKRQLLRVVYQENSLVDADKTGKKPGRGAYICYNQQCLIKAKKIKAIERALNVKGPDINWPSIEQAIMGEE